MLCVMIPRWIQDVDHSRHAGHVSQHGTINQLNYLSNSNLHIDRRETALQGSFKGRKDEITPRVDDLYKYIEISPMVMVISCRNLEIE